MNYPLRTALALALVLSCGQRARTAEQLAASLTGGSTFGSAASYTVGWKFTLNSDISVTQLGIVDADGSGLVQDHTVRLYNATGDTILTTVTIPQSTPGESTGGYSGHFVPITPIHLTTGTEYILAKNKGGDNYRYDAILSMAPEINWISGPACSGDLPASVGGFNISHGSGSYFGPNFKFAAAITPPSALSLSAPTGRAVYQRDTFNSADVIIEGVYSGDIDRVEARALTRTGYGGMDTAWVVIDAAPTGGTFTAALPLAGGWYDIEVRSIKDEAQVGAQAVERVGVGEVFITAGQSNSANYGSPQQNPGDDRVSAYNLATGSWQVANDPQPYAGGSGGSPWPKMGDLLAAKYDVPVGVVALGVGSTTVAQWQVGGHYARILAALKALDPTGFRAILWHQGESDSLAGTEAATYQGLLAAIVAQSRLDAGWNVPWGVAIASYHPGSPDANEAKVAAGQRLVIDGDLLVFLGAQTDDFHNLGYLSDTVHFNQLGLDAHAQQWVDALDAIIVVTVIPEPATLGMLIVGGLIASVRRRRKLCLPQT